MTGRKRNKKEGPTPNEGGRLLGEIMSQNDWSQVHVERLVGTHAGTVSRLLTGERKPGRDLAEAFRLKLGISPLLWTTLVGTGPGGRVAEAS